LKNLNTKASELRSKSVLAHKALLDMDRNLDYIKMKKGYANEASFTDIEKEKARLSKVFLLPPLQMIQEMDSKQLLQTAHINKTQSLSPMSYIIP